MKSTSLRTTLLLLPSAFVLLVLVFQWTLIGWLTPFLFPVLQLAAWGSLAVASSIAVVRFCRKRGYRRWHNYLPLSSAALVLALACYFPFTELWLKANFVLFRHARESFASDFFAGRRPNVKDQNGYLHLSGAFAGLISEDDGTVAVYKNGDRAGLYFFTYRGILGQSTGYYYAPSDARPLETDYFHVVKHVAPRWYLVETE